MTRLLRITGFPAHRCRCRGPRSPGRFGRFAPIWPLLFGLPLAIQIGMGVAALGLVVVMGSLIAERIEDREADRRLLEDRPESSSRSE